MVLPCMMVIVQLSRCVVHPQSHDNPIEVSVPAGNRGKMCPCCTVSGRWGILRLHVYVETILLPSEISTEIGLTATC